MTSLYVTTHGASLRRSGAEVVVSTDGRILDKAPLRRLDYVVVHPSVQITSQALTALARKGAQVAYISHTGDFIARIAAPVGGNVQLRYQQYRAVHDPTPSLRIAQALVHAKIANQRQVLIRRANDDNTHQDHTRAIIRYLKHQNRNTPQASTLDSLRGIEGNAARYYWKAFAHQIRAHGFSFTGRRYRPNPDPVNALLSFGYTLLTTRAAGHIEAAGLDPGAGFFHGVIYKRPSLALDLIEPFRAPIVDRMIIRMINLRILQPDGFQRQTDGACRMTDPARKRFYEEWENTLEQNEVDAQLHRQAYQLRTHLLEETPWQPYTWKAR